MKTWNFKVKRTPQDTINKLNAALGSANGFLFKLNHDKNDSVTFKLRKRVLYAYQIIIRNRIVVNGKILKTSHKNETDLEISFSQHFLVTLHVFAYWGLGLIGIISGIIHHSNMYIYGGILFVTGIALWFHVKKNSEKHIQKYKELISEILADET